MKVYGDLIVRGDARSLDVFIDALQRHLTNGWSRDRDREQQVGRAALGAMYCFACAPLVSRPASELWLATHTDGHLYVSNILAENLPSLTYDQYNAILGDFHDTCVRPAAEASGVKTELTSFDPQLEDFMSTGIANLLRSFSAHANRSILHPLDRKRWNEFLVAAHREGCRLSADMLQRWLIEEQKWPEDEAINLAIEYDHARDLLEIYEARPA
ncbi:MAG TPA: hypothetical protein VER03_06895 [Bryobacteraceae bacterium]|nr:hypothetical protein [Bryobacteraceae bacterium]